MTKRIIFITMVTLLLSSTVTLLAQNKYGETVHTGVGFKYFKFNDTLGKVGQLLPDTAFLKAKWPYTPNYYIYGAREGYTSIADSATGRPILYCNGLSLYDSNGYYIEGGDSLMSTYYNSLGIIIDQSTDYSIILPINNKQFKLFMPGFSDSNLQQSLISINVGPWCMDKLYQYDIDMTLNGGKGKVTRKLHNILQYGERLNKVGNHAVKDANGTGWLLYHAGYGSVTTDSLFVYGFHITGDTVIHLGRTYMGIYGMYMDSIQFQDIETRGGQLNISNDGTKLVVGIGLRQLSTANINRCTGALTAVQHYNRPLPPPPDSSTNLFTWWGSITGVTISPNNRYIYFSAIGRLYQLDTQEPDSVKAWYQIDNRNDSATWMCNTQSWFGSLYTSNNNVVYVTCFGGGYSFPYITNPDEQGSLLNYSCRGLMYDTTILPLYRQYIQGFGNLLNYNLAPAPWLCWPASTTAALPIVQNVSIAPNPTHTAIQLTIKQAYTAPLPVTITSTQGKHMGTYTIPPGSTNYSIACHTWPSGVYIVSIKDWVGKVVVY